MSPDTLGICYAHEHVVIRGPFVEQNFPDFLLEDFDKICEELNHLRSLGVGTMIDAMPIDSGRSAVDLATVSRRTGMDVVAPTGLHLRLYYPTDHWYDTIDEDSLTQRLIDEIEREITDDGEPSGVKAGVIKIAGSRDQLTDLERRNFRAAGRAQAVTGCPILTHTEQGTAALEQIQLLRDAGANLEHVVLSHVDRIADVTYHKEILSTGVRLEFDSAMRYPANANVTFDLVMALAPEFSDSIVLGMDAARFSYWSSFGGKPGLDFLVTQFAPKLRAEGLDEQLIQNLLVNNPAQAYSFDRNNGMENKQ